MDVHIHAARAQQSRIKPVLMVGFEYNDPNTSWPIKVRELEDGPVVEMQEVEQTLQRPARVHKTPKYLKDYIT